MSSLHSWAGLLPGWLLFIVFLFGTAAFFQQEISSWMRPELSNAPADRHVLDKVGRFLSTHAPGAASWNISLPPGRGGDPITVRWTIRDGDPPKTGEATLDPASGQAIVVRETRGGWFLYRMHFDLHYMPVMWARYLVSIAALSMLVAILSGVVTHKKIFADFFLLRLGKGQRSWLDAHNAFAVLPLPFHLMITYTGLVTLLFTLMPWAISATFPDAEEFSRLRYPASMIMEATGHPAELLSLGQLAGRAEVLWNGGTPRYISVSNPDDDAAMAQFYPTLDTLAADRPPLVFDGVTGELLQTPQRRGAALTTEAVMIDLHAGRFSGPALRWLYFLSGVSGTVMIATGLVLWTVKRRAKLPDPARPHVGFRLVERLNIGVIAGSSAGIAVYFLANRLLPVEMASRADWEINSLFIAWGGVFVWTLGRPTKRAWVEALAACGVLYALVPVVNALTTARGLIPSLIAKDWVFVGFDLVMLTMAVACTFTAWKIATHKPKALPGRKTRMAVDAVI